MPLAQSPWPGVPFLPQGADGLSSIQLQLPLCSTPSTAACFWRGLRNFQLALAQRPAITKACWVPNLQTETIYMQRLSLRSAIRQNAASVLTPPICVYWKAPLLQPPKKIFPSLERRLFLTMYSFRNVFLTYLESLFIETQAHWFSLFCSWPWIQERKTYPRTAFTTAAWQSTITCFVTVLLVWGFFPNMRLQIHFIH